jgi:hypothetical protein
MQSPSHRNLFNRDCDLVFYQFRNRPKDEPLTAQAAVKAIQRSVDVLADNGINTLLVNPNTNVVWYPSKTVPTALTGYRRGDASFTRGSAIACGVPADQIDAAAKEIARFLDTFLDVQEAGVDWLAEVAKACHKRSVSPWLSVRMNDMHATVHPDPRTHADAYENGPLFKNQANRLRGTRLNPADGTFTYFMGINYERREVRDYMFAMIRDMVENYDFEGLELDWLRNPLCCEPNASQKTIDMMTGWIAEIRALTKQTGRTYPVGLRIPGDLGKLRAIGLDVRALAKAGLIDFISPSNFWQTSWDMPHDRLRAELGPTVAIYGVVEGVANWLSCYAPTTVGKTKPPGNHVEATVRFMATSPELLRGNAAGKLALGADGISHYNFFIAESGWCLDFGMRTDYANLRDLDNLEALRDKPKHYTLSTPPSDPRSPPFWEQTEQLPAWIEPEMRRGFTIPMCAEPSDAQLELLIQVVVERPAPNHESRITNHDLGVSFNGSWPNFEAQPTAELLFPASIYTHHIASHQAFNYRFPVSTIREGWNEVVVYNESHQRASLHERLANAVNVVSVELAVK